MANDRHAGSELAPRAVYQRPGNTDRTQYRVARTSASDVAEAHARRTQMSGFVVIRTSEPPKLKAPQQPVNEKSRSA